MIIRKYPIYFSCERYYWEHKPFKRFYFSLTKGHYKWCYCFSFGMQGLKICLFFYFNKEVFNMFHEAANKYNKGGG